MKTVQAAKALLAPLYHLVLGSHPHNTVCSFNYLNVRHITRFLTAQRARLSGADLVVVDVGAGGSPYQPIFADICAKYIAVDRAAAFDDAEPRAIERREGSAEALPVEGASADLVLCNQVLEHVEDPARAVAEAYRVLRPAGLFLGSVPHISPVHLEPTDFRRYTDLGLRQLLTEASFEVAAVEGNGPEGLARALECDDCLAD